MTGLIFKTNQCFDIYEKAAQKLGYPKNEVVSMMAFNQIILKENARGKDFSKAEIEKEYGAVSEKYTQSNAEQKWPTTRLQEKYDKKLLDALWIAVLNEFSKGHTNDTRRLATALLEENMNSAPEEIQEADTAIEVSPTSKTAKNQALKVEDIILRTVTNYGLNGAYVDNEVSILFTNGEVLTNPVDALSELNATESKREYPKRWNTWSKRNGVIYVTKSWKGKTYDWKKWFDLRAAKSGQKIVGKYQTSDAFGGSRVINVSTVSFDGKGRFAWKTVKGGETGWIPEYSKTNEAGTYRLLDHEIELKYNNGRTEKLFFGFYPKDFEHFVIGSSHFAPLK